MAHSYVSAFIAPMIVFFAVSGSLQLYDLHEAHGTYKPIALISSMARLHKNQVFAPEAPRGPGPAGPPSKAKNGERDATGKASAERNGRERPEPTFATQALKALFVVEAIALVATTLLGVWIGVTHPKRARSFWFVLPAGTLLPILLIVV